MRGGQNHDLPKRFTCKSPEPVNEYITLYGQRDFADVITVKDLKMRDYPGLFE